MTFSVLPATVPQIPPLFERRGRPLFSVMLPTFKPGEMLRRSLESVLAQDVPPDRMQIAVVDDGSRCDDVTALVRSVDPTGRIEIHADGAHLGIGGNWNRAVGLARGHLVHLLHQDDLVLPGFYASMERAFLRAPLIGMAFCRSRIVDEQGRLIKITPRHRWWPGVLSDWLPRIALRQRVQTPAVVVARSTYELLGGYRTDLCHTLDWEMWVRIAARMPVWHDPAPLAVYRRHPASETSRLAAEGAIWPDLAHTIRLNADALASVQKAPLTSSSARWYAHSALRESLKQLLRDDHDAAHAALAHARRLMQLIADPDTRDPVERRAMALERRIHAGTRAA